MFNHGKYKCDVRMNLPVGLVTRNYVYSSAKVDPCEHQHVGLCCNVGRIHVIWHCPMSRPQEPLMGSLSGVFEKRLHFVHCDNQFACDVALKNIGKTSDIYLKHSAIKRQPFAYLWMLY